MQELKVKELLSLENTICKSLLEKLEYPWEALDKIGDFIINYPKRELEGEYRELRKNVWVHFSVVLPTFIEIKGPAIICQGAEIRHGAFIRENVVIGKGAVIGNSCEIKNSIIFDKAQVPHFNYVGDSILGYFAHLGAGVVLSNVRADKGEATISINSKDEKINTGLRKFGAIVGDFGEIGCNSVLNPATIIGKGTQVYPLSRVRGYVPPNSIFKAENLVIQRR